MEHPDFDCQFQMESADADRLRGVCRAAVADAPEGEAFEQIGDMFVFGPQLSITFTTLMPEPYALVVLNFIHPAGMEVLMGLCTSGRAPIQMIFPDEGDIMLLSAGAIDEFGPVSWNSGAASFDMLLSLSLGQLRRQISDPGAQPVEDVQIVMSNPAFAPDRSVTRFALQRDDEPELARYEFVLTPTNLSIETIFFGLFGVPEFSLGADQKSAYFIDEEREMRTYAFLIDYVEGTFWTLTISAPDLGTLQDNQISAELAERSLLVGADVKVFGVISSDDLQETLTVQQFIAGPEGMETGALQLFNASE